MFELLQATWEASSLGWIRLEHLVSCSLVLVSVLVAVMAASTWVKFGALLSEAANSGADGVTDLHLVAVEIWDYEAAGWEEVYWEYEVDFMEMIQTNLGTRTVRRIRRFVLQQHGTKSK